jgi:hypothetical protein
MFTSGVNKKESREWCDGFGVISRKYFKQHSSFVEERVEEEDFDSHFLCKKRSR